MEVQPIRGFRYFGVVQLFNIVLGRGPSRPLGLSACLSVTGTGHGFEAWPVPGRPGQDSRKARQAAQNRQAMACLQCFLSVNKNVIFDQET
jgi:hypothetical protein